MTISQIKKIVEKVTGIDDLGASNRKRWISDSRFVFYQLAREYAKRPEMAMSNHLQAIGNAVGRDRTTVIHGLNEFQHLSQDNFWHGGWVYKLCVERMKQELRESLMDKFIPSEPMLCKEVEFEVIPPGLAS